MEKITKRQMYNAMINYAENGEFSFETEDGVFDVGTDEIAAFARNEIALLDKKAAKAKETAAKKKDEADALTEAIANALGSDFEPIAEIAARIEDAGATVSKCIYRLNKLVEQGIAEKTDIKVTDGEGKNRTIKGYRAVIVAE